MKNTVIPGEQAHLYCAYKCYHIVITCTEAPW